ncbi:MAG: VCBS repeat-containing protein, partial [Actinobacteria bacterium]|nr:VCBS repeat-containing protein [Actinomycetota bacterium]
MRKLLSVALSPVLVAATLLAVQIVRPPAAAHAATPSIPLTYKFGLVAPTGGVLPIHGPDEAFSAAAVGDVDGDGQPDIIAGAMNGHIYGWHTNGQLFLDFQVGGGAIQSSPALVDLDGDGHLDITVGTMDGWVRTISNISGQFKIIVSFRDQCASSAPMCGVFDTPTVADITGDGRPDIIFSSYDQHVYAYRTDGTLNFSHYTYDTMFSSAAVGDI